MNLRTRVGLHLAACAAAATVAGSSSAAIVWSGIVNINIPSNIDGVYLNVVTGQSGTSGSAVAGWDVNPYSATTLTWFSSTGGGYARGGGSSATLVDNLAFGTVIGSGLSYGSGSVETTGATAFILNSDQNLVGFRFVNGSGAGATTHYGWMRIQVSGTLSAQPRAIVEYAYESDANGSITAGTIPAPGAVALLGLAGLVGRRRRA